MPRLDVADYDDDPDPDGEFAILRYGDDFIIHAQDMDDEQVAEAVSRWLARGCFGPMQ